MTSTSPMKSRPPVEPTPTPGGPDRTGRARGNPTGRTRISGIWAGVIAGVVVLALLLVFILQNTKSVKVSYFVAHGTMPLGVALLLAAVGGVLLAAAVGSMRIWQLRHRLKNPEDGGKPTAR